MKKTIVSFLLIVAAFYITLFTYPQPKSQVLSKTVASVVAYQTINKNTKEYTVPVGSTALDLLSKTNKVETKGTGINAFIKRINNKRADETKKEFWAFYVNSKQASVGAGSYILKQNDNIEWKIENF